MPSKKIIFVIVEGPSDDEAIGVIMSRFYDKNHLHVHIVHSDITTDYSVNERNIVSKLGNIVKDYAKGKFQKSDFVQIIQITDTDGVFIPDDRILENLDKTTPFYLTTEIQTHNRNGIINRNQRKRVNLNKLASISKIWDIPYSIYYMSCNLDHALYGKLNSTDEEKERDAFNFAKRYKNDIPAFLEFISTSDFSVKKEYKASWEFIREDLHSLERFTNFGLCFNKSSNE